MNVTRIWLRGFGAYDGCTFDAPYPGGKVGPPVELRLESGKLYVVTGQNGSGKSTLVEAVAYALWGKTLRGEPLLHNEAGDPRPYVSVTVDGLSVNRGRRYGQPKLHFCAEDEKTPTGLGAEYDTAKRLGGAEFGTAKEAQRVLDTYVGTFEQWRRTHVFSSADAAHFSLATDGERKRLIEGFLGLERFDEALGASREAIRKAERAEENTADFADGAAKRLREAERWVERLTGDDADPEPEYVLSAPPQAQDTAALREQARQARLAANQALVAGSAERAKAAQLAEGYAKLAEGEPCPCCGQWVNADALERAREWVEVAEHAAEKATQAGQLEHERLVAEELEFARRLERANAASADREAWKARSEAHAAWAKRRAKAAEELATWRSRVSQAALELADANRAHDQAIAELRELQACERVLGLKGVRSAVLASSLGALNALTDAWLRKLGMPDLWLKLSHYTERADGSIADAIALDLGRGKTGRPYRSASGGERRRADVALLLALGELAAGASGRPRGTIFADEVFDCLDREGQEAVLGALLELARKGPSVVLVTHAGLGDLLRGREGVVRLEVDGGQVRQLE